MLGLYKPTCTTLLCCVVVPDSCIAVKGYCRASEAMEIMVCRATKYIHYVHPSIRAMHRAEEAP